MISLRFTKKDKQRNAFQASDESESEADKNMKWNVDNRMNAAHINFVICCLKILQQKNFFWQKTAPRQISTIEYNLIFIFLLFLLNRISAFFLV